MNIRSSLIVTLCLSFSFSAHAQEWTRFRGPNGDGINRNVDIPVKWTDKDYAWKVNLPGEGIGSPVLWGQKLFIIAADQEAMKRMILCIDAQNGKTLWSRRFDFKTHKKHKVNTYATGTCAVEANRVYFTWGQPESYLLFAFDHEGNEVWERKFGKYKSGHGYGVSPTIVDDLVVLPNDQGVNSSIIAVNKTNGKTVWETPRETKRASYSTPCVFTSKDGRKKQIIVTDWHHGISGLDASSGKVLWEHNVFGRPHPERAIASPIVNGDTIIGTCGFTTLNKHCIVIRPAWTGSTDDAKIAWKTDRSVPHCPTVLVVGDRLYLWNDLGIVSCLNAANGKVIYKERVPDQRGKFYCSPVCAGKNIFCFSEFGTVGVIATGDQFKVLGTFELEDEIIRSTPALANGNMYLRTLDKLFCIKGARIQ